MNKLLKNNIRESAIIAAISAVIVTTAAVAERKNTAAVKLTDEVGPPIETVISYLDEVVQEEPVEVPVEEPEPVKMLAWEDRDIEFSDRDVFCLQQNIYYEARGEAPKDQRAVAWVTLNRVEHETWPDSVCGVVWQPSQFSWTRHTVEEVPDFKNEIERKAWQRAKQIAKDVMAKFKMQFPDPTKGADHYHANYVWPRWADSSRVTAYAGAHVFYKLR